MLRRPEWASTLLAAVEKGDLHRSEVANDQWTQLRRNPNLEVSTRARALDKVTATGKADANLESIIQKLIPQTRDKGDVQLGRQSFEKNCQVCHLLNGIGAHVGPDLTGIAPPARSQSYS